MNSAQCKLLCFCSKRALPWKLESGTPKQRLFRQSGLSDRCLRILIEPGQEPGNAKAHLDDIESGLQEIQCPRLLHGFETSSWEFIALAARRGYDTRIDFEDTLTLPQGRRAKDNGELVAEAWNIARASVTIKSAPDATRERESFCLHPRLFRHG